MMDNGFRPHRSFLKAAQTGPRVSPGSPSAKRANSAAFRAFDRGAIADAYAWAKTAGLRTGQRRIRAALRERGICPHAAPDIARALDDARRIHCARVEARRYHDPLREPRITIPPAERRERLQLLRERAAFRSAAVRLRWRADWACEAIRLRDESLARLATVESICRAARAAGWRVRHTSRSSGRATSRYLVRGGVHVRVSDHHLPCTLRREIEGPRWDVDIVADDWRTASLADYLFLLGGEPE